jgi:ribonuclease P protein component
MLKASVLRKKSDFDRLYKRGKSTGEKYIVLFVYKNGLDYNRTAFLASKKVGKSVDRNRARRLMKESYRGLSDTCEKGYDLLFIARNTILGKKYKDVSKSMYSALKRLGVIREK